ncbi:hypothetical protein BpOF4_06805 [Alkalihalophilus pseudofirmus OF4]|uniref:Uncharacterized protein n=1 Tax=Alkalihalophilus pseudofirmus (strain ATCC BAA-2126 / JCM 17055 / OF4) TaxID=398511 RepID=D3G0E4_ALKPO|nr:hypothetical protein [Alkalihalophilus pseudofirmus]ADC49419.1 hypothetical protein BpOF4_06805 [Alkalihalophilus pseudofirmus OF4]
MLYVFLLITALSIFFAFKMKKPLMLSVPFAAILVYFVFQIAMVPLGFFETVRFIFDLR